MFFNREHAPSIIFMDEIDSIGSARMESGSGNGDSEVQRTMLELLNQLDGFEASNKIKVLFMLLCQYVSSRKRPVYNFWYSCSNLHINLLHTPSKQVLMATNRIDILDQALLRPGRIDRKIEFPNPNEEVYSTFTMACFNIWKNLVLTSYSSLKPLTIIFTKS